jgi:elongation factor Ts
MAITTEQIKELREATGAGILDCRKALEQADGDYKKAVDILREKGLAKAAKRADRAASEGVLELYTHGNGRVGVMVEVNSETDFVARSKAFRDFAHEVALQIAASAPIYISADDIPEEVLEHERQIAKTRALQDGKPEAVVDRIVQGRIEKYKDEVSLLRQPYIRDEDMTIEKLLHQHIGSIGENIVIRRFVRWEVGESTAD